MAHRLSGTTISCVECLSLFDLKLLNLLKKRELRKGQKSPLCSSFSGFLGQHTSFCSKLDVSWTCHTSLGAAFTDSLCDIVLPINIDYSRTHTQHGNHEICIIMKFDSASSSFPALSASSPFRPPTCDLG